MSGLKRGATFRPPFAFLGAHMSKKHQSEKPKPAEPKRYAYVVFGLDPNGKPKGARFQAEQYEQAAEACTSLKLEIHQASTPELLDLAPKLPSGRIYARGRAFVPFIKRTLYDQLHAASRISEPEQAVVMPVPVPSGPPRTWEGIEPGHIVLAKSAAEDEGYFEAIVLSRADTKFILKWRDYPAEKPIERSVPFIALLNPDAEVVR